MNVTDAVDFGSRRDLLLALRTRLAVAMDTTKGSRELVSLSRQIEAVNAEIADIPTGPRRIQSERR